MTLTQRRLAGVAAALSAIAIAALMSTAGAAAGATRSTGPVVAGGWGGFIAFPGAEPLAGQDVGVIGPTIITTAPTTFINTNNQVTAGGVWSGGQVGP